MKLKKPKRALASHNRIVELIWLDSTGRGDPWCSDDGVVRPVRCCSIGYEVERTPNHITMMQTFSEDGGRANQFSVPAGAIESVKLIRR